MTYEKDDFSINEIDAFITSHQLASLVTFNKDQLKVIHIPLQFSHTPLPHGTLKGHVECSNDILDDLSENIEALAIFHGPEGYVSPSWYPSKKESEKVVPTWNYAKLHIYGKIRIRNEKSWILSHLNTLTNLREAGFEKPWTIKDAPEDFIDKLTDHIQGIEIAITRITGKFKLGQNRSEADKKGVIEALRSSSNDGCSELADLVEQTFENS